MEQSSLLFRLSTLRTVIRRRLLLYGFCLVVAGGVAAGLTIVTLDWLLWFPPLLRALVDGLFLAGFLWACLHWIIRPLSVRFQLDEVASRLEAHFPSLRDRLTSTVDFILRGGTGSTTMMKQVITNTERMTRAIPLESALSLRPLFLRGGLLVTSMTLLAAVLFYQPDWCNTGVQRYLHPWRGIEWPRRVTIRPLTDDLVVALGESTTVRMEVARGMNPRLRAVVHLREGHGPTTTLTMQQEEGVQAGRAPRFRATVDAVTNNLTYWFEAGDANTSNHPFTIRPVRRPEVVTCTVAVEPPSYAPERPVRLLNLLEGPAHAPVGGYAAVMVSASKAIPLASTAQQATLLREQGPDMALIVDPLDRRKLSARFNVTHDIHFRVALRDQNGLTNRGARCFSILATPDQPPTVTIVKPASSVAVTPHGSVELLIRVDDDFGITRLDLQLQHVGGRHTTIPLTDQLISAQTEQRKTTGKDKLINRPSAGGAVKALVPFLWSVTSMSLSPGDVLVYTAAAQDNYTSAPGALAPVDSRGLPQCGFAAPPARRRRLPAGPNGAGGQIGRSSPRRIEIISDVEFDIRLQSDLAQLEARIRQATLDEEDIRDATKPLKQVEATLKPLSNVQRNVVGGVATRQVRLVRRLRELAGRFEKLTVRIKHNRGPGRSEARGATESSPEPFQPPADAHAPGDKKQTDAGSDASFQADASVGNRMRAMSDALLLIANGAMSAAAHALDRTREHTSAEDQQHGIRDAIESETTAIDRLHGLLRSMSQWGAFTEVVTRAEGLLDRQEELRINTARLGAGLLGKKVESLSADQVARMTRLARRQQQLATDVEQLLARMRRIVQATREKDPSQAGAIDEGLRAARARQMARQQQRAARMIQLNRTAAATIAQRAAGEAIKKMIEALREHRDRELQELHKRLLRAQDQVAALIEQQRDLRGATHEAGLIGVGKADLNELARQQRTLKRNTLLLGDEMAQKLQTALVAKRMQRAAVPMGQAQEHLATGQTASATRAQDNAIALLEDARSRLEEQAQQTADEAFRRTLAQIRQDLETILTAQREVNHGIIKLQKAIEQRGRMGRLEARSTGKLVREQVNVRSLIEDQVRDFDRVPVYKWALKRAADWMDDSRTALSQRRIDDNLVSLTGRIERELENLIQAIVETQALPVDTQFVESQNDNGGGSGAGVQHKPVPSVAELLVLKAMQVGINKTTQKLHESFDMATASEQQLRKLQIVGEDQAQVRRLTELVTQRARSMGGGG